MHNNPLNALLIFAKYPKPGRVKTRLSPPLSPEEAAELYRCMLLDTLKKTGPFPGAIRMIFIDGSPCSNTDFQSIAPDALILKQDGAGLGERMHNAFETAFAAGCQAVVITGTDSPHMPVKRITEAFNLLNEGAVDAVFGPCEDGGYYLLGMRKLLPELFKNIPWSSPDTLTMSLEAAKSAGVKTALLPDCYDLDTIADLRRLKEEVTQSAGAPKTLSFLNSLTVI